MLSTYILNINKQIIYFAQIIACVLAAKNSNYCRQIQKVPDVRPGDNHLGKKFTPHGGIPSFPRWRFHAVFSSFGNREVIKHSK